MKKNKFYKSGASEAASDFFGMNKVQRINISACAIMKNETSHVEAWLENVRSFASEIIVVDTGSQDGTREFLQNQVDVKLILHEWQNDFAMAKNVALQEAAGDWLVFTDADECFYQPENIIAYLRQVAKQSADVVFCPIDNVDADNHNEIINSDVVPRLIKNHVGIQYMGAVHEQLTKGSESWQNIKYVVADRNLAIRHTGYSTKVIPLKHQRNYEILRQVMEKSNKPEMYYGFFSESLLGLEEYQQALEYAILAMESSYQPAIQKERFAQVAIESMDRLGLAITDIFSQQQAEVICQMILQRNKWHVGTLCQWLDMKLAFAENEHQEKIQDIIQDLLNIYEENTQDIQQLAALLEQNGYIYLAKEFSSYMHIEKENNLEEVYQFLQQKEFDKLEKKILPLTADNVQLLFVALLGCSYSSGSWYQEKLQLLPEAKQVLVKLYHGQAVENVLMEPQHYIDMLPALLAYGTREMQARYLKLAVGMPGNALKAVGYKLAQMEHYGEAVEILEQIQTDDEAVTADFWLLCGKCLYYLEDYANALAAVQQALVMDKSLAEAAAYESWCRERLDA